jgi:LysM repeat protein
MRIGRAGAITDYGGEMKFLRVIGLIFFGASLLNAQDWTDEKSAKTAAVPKASRPADAPAETPAEAPAAPATEEAAEAPEEQPAASDSGTSVTEGAVHEVQKGDTLWDLADTFYKNPYQWQKIWEANKEGIADPNLIYPNQKVTIPGTDGSVARQEQESQPSAEEESSPSESPEAPPESKEEAASKLNDLVGDEAPAAVAATPSEEEAPAAEEAAQAPATKTAKSKKSSGLLTTGTFLSKEEWEGSGRIVGDKEHKMLLSVQDVVYLNIGSSNGVKPRMRGAIYRQGRMIRDNKTGEKLGYSVNRVGTLEIAQEVTDETASAVILNSNDAVKVGDFISLEEQ